MERESSSLSRHWAARVLAGIGLVCTFAAAAILGVTLHADLAVSHHLASRLVQGALATTLGGKLVLSPLERVSLTQVSVARATLLDAYAHPVLELSRVRIDLSLRALARELFFGNGSGAIVVSHVEVGRATVTLLPDPKTGEPTLVRAVSPAPSPSGGGSKAPGPEVVMPSIEIDDAIVSARLPAIPRLEARLRSVRGRVHGGQKGIAVDVDRFGIVVRGSSLPAHGTGTFALRAPGPLQSTFEGFVGDIEIKATATLDGTHLDVSGDVPRATPSAARQLLPTWPLSEAVSVHVDARGDLPNLVAHARFAAGRGSVALEGPITLGEQAHGVLSLHADHLDAQALGATAFPTDITVEGTIDARGDGDGLKADVTARTLPSAMNGTLVPALDARAAIARDGATGTVEIHEPGLPIKASFSVLPSLVVDVDAETADVPLSGIRRLDLGAVRGRGHARAHAHLVSRTLNGTVDADFGGLATGGAEVGRARVHMDVVGALDAPERLRATTRIEASSVRLSGVDVDRVVLVARGAPKRFDFDAELGRAGGPSLKAKGSAALTPRPSLEKTLVVLEQGPVRIEGEVAALDVERGRADIENVRVTGAGGNIVGALRIGPELLEITADGEGVDLDALSRAMGLPRGLASGTLRINTDLAIGRDVTRGHVGLGLGNATLGAVGGLSLRLSADLDDRHLTGEASGLVAGLGTFGTTFDTHLDGSPLEPASWRRATGTAELQVSEVRLALLSVMLPKGSPIESLAGRVYARLLFERKSADAPLPSAFATVSTRDLAFTVHREEGADPLRIAGTNLTATVQCDGTTGDSTGSMLAVDAHGDLFTATGAVRLDIGRLSSDPAGALAALVVTPLEMVVTVPPRTLGDLPPPLTQTGLTGSVSGVGSIRGTLSHPTLFVSLQGSALAPASAEGARPVDLHAEGQYEWTTSTVSARATATVGGRDVAGMAVRGTLPSGPESFLGTARVDLRGVPLDALGMTGEHALSGSLVGSATISRTDEGGALGADVRIVDAVVAHTSLGEGRLELKTAGAMANATLSFEAPHGTLEASGSAPLTWVGPLPSLGNSAPIRARAIARDFAAAAISPVVTSVLSRVGGRLDADLALELTPVGGDDPGWVGGVEGKASLRDGNLLIDALGLEVNDLTATAEAHGAGTKTSVAIRDIVGRVRSSKANLRGSAALEIDGVKVMRGSALLDASDMPVLFRGAPQGRITGRAEAKLLRQSDRMQVDVEIPTLLVRLPQASAREVHSLERNPDVSVAQFEREGPAEPVALPWRLSLRLGDSVGIRRADVDLRLTGAPVLDIGDEAEMSGSIDLVPGGRIPVLGKVFSVEAGKVVFDTGDPSNPHVNLRAVSRASNDALIYVEMTGTMRDAKIALRSDPPLPEAEVFALLLGGSSTEAAATGDASTSKASGAGAVAIGSGVAIGVNQLVANSPVEVRVETTQQNRPRYTAAVRLRENLWFEASEYQQADYGATSSTDRNVISGTVDYRFTRRWSLRTELGTAGGALDLLWQYRY